MEGDSVSPEITPVDDVEGPKDVENIPKGSQGVDGVQVDQNVPEVHIETPAASCKDPQGQETITTLYIHHTVIENQRVK